MNLNLNAMQIQKVAKVTKHTCDLRDLGIHIIALPSREQVTMLSCVNLEKIYKMESK